MILVTVMTCMFDCVLILQQQHSLSQLDSLRCMEIEHFLPVAQCSGTACLLLQFASLAARTAAFNKSLKTYLFFSKFIRFTLFL